MCHICCSSIRLEDLSRCNQHHLPIMCIILPQIRQFKVGSRKTTKISLQMSFTFQLPTFVKRVMDYLDQINRSGSLNRRPHFLIAIALTDLRLRNRRIPPPQSGALTAISSFSLILRKTAVLNVPTAYKTIIKNQLKTTTNLIQK